MRLLRLEMGVWPLPPRGEGQRAWRTRELGQALEEPQFPEQTEDKPKEATVEEQGQRQGRVPSQEGRGEGRELQGHM